MGRDTPPGGTRRRGAWRAGHHLHRGYCGLPADQPGFTMTAMQVRAGEMAPPRSSTSTRHGRRATCDDRRETTADQAKLLSVLVIVGRRWSLSRGLSADYCGLTADHEMPPAHDRPDQSLVAQSSERPLSGTLRDPVLLRQG